MTIIPDGAPCYCGKSGCMDTAVGFHAAIQGDHLGQKSVVMGAGCIGLVSMMALKATRKREIYFLSEAEEGKAL